MRSKSSAPAAEELSVKSTPAKGEGVEGGSPGGLRPQETSTEISLKPVDVFFFLLWSYHDSL